MDRTRAWYTKWLSGARLLDRERGSLVKDVLRMHPLSRRMRKILQQEGHLLFLYVDIVRFAELERRVGERVATEMLQVVEATLRKVSSTLFGEEQLLDVENFWGDDFLVFLHSVTGTTRSLYDQVQDFRQAAIRELNQARHPLFTAPLDLHVGYAELTNRGDSLDRQLYQAIKQAVRMARKKATGGDELQQAFHQLLQERAITAHFQPILSFETGEPLGWEALSRGPQGSQLERPDVLFTLAEEWGELYALEKICRERAIERADDLPAGAKLFLNLNPRTLDDPQFIKGETRRLLERHGLSPSHLVFEITERHSIQDYSAFRKTLEHYRHQGYLIAVDDAGAGYSSLQSIVELAPDFIKMDMSLVRGVHNDPVKQALLEAFVTLARKIKCKIIAEGIEQEEEVKTLLALGIEYGQGFLLGRPQREFVTAVPEKVLHSIHRRREERLLIAGNRSTLMIGTIATQTAVVDPERTIKDVHELFEQRRQLTSVVVAAEGRPLGLVTRDYLYFLLGSQYGVPLYYKRVVRELMDAHPLIVEQHQLIDEVSALATGRNNLKRYDDIIVVDHGEYRGIVSVQTLLDVMSKMKIEIAKYANPLTGLPGNLLIEEELRTRVRRRAPFTVLYIDLDQFKHFNDVCGFEHGDAIILFFSQLLVRQMRQLGTEQDFLGHIGGDDFVIITTPETADGLATRLLALFDRVVRRWLPALVGEVHSTIALTVSVAGLDITADAALDPAAIAARAAEMKKKAKAHAGSSYVREKAQS